MGIGLSMQQVSTNRLPGWDKMSYGYHGDDGNAFCGSGTGQVSQKLKKITYFIETEIPYYL